MNETTTATKPAAKPAATANGTTKVRKEVDRRVRSGVEAATSKVMNLIGRLPPGDQRKVINAVTALVSKSDD